MCKFVFRSCSSPAKQVKETEYLTEVERLKIENEKLKALRESEEAWEKIRLKEKDLEMEKAMAAMNTSKNIPLVDANEGEDDTESLDARIKDVSEALIAKDIAFDEIRYAYATDEREEDGEKHAATIEQTTVSGEYDEHTSTNGAESESKSSDSPSFLEEVTKMDETETILASSHDDIDDYTVYSTLEQSAHEGKENSSEKVNQMQEFAFNDQVCCGALILIQYH